MWSYRDGFKVGEADFIFFENSTHFKLKSDTIYYNSIPRAIIKNLNKKNFIMEVSSIDGKERGTYRNVEESLKGS